jgi:hypothetical protein
MNVGPNVKNVCFSFRQVCDPMASLRDIGRILDPKKCDFDFFTVLIPISPRERLHEDILTISRGYARDMTLSFGLQACFMGFKGGNFLRDPEGDENKHLLEEWVRILEPEKPLI